MLPFWRHFFFFFADAGGLQISLADDFIFRVRRGIISFVYEEREAK